MHAVARLVLHPVIPNIQAHGSRWGREGAARASHAGANDLGGTLMNESITRAGGRTHGQELPPEAMEALIRSIGREPAQRTTLYRAAPQERVAASFNAPTIAPLIATVPAARRRKVSAASAR